MDREEFRTLWEGRYVENYPDETFALVQEVEKITPLNIIIEIGVKHCGTLVLWEKLLKPGDTLIGIDENPKELILRYSGYSNVAYPPWDWAEVPTRWAECPLGYTPVSTCVLNTYDPDSSDRDVHIVSSDSTAPDTLRRVADILQGRQADFIYHDGGHYGEVPKLDFQNIVLPFLRPGGLFCIADLTCGGETDPPTGIAGLITSLPPSAKPMSIIQPRRAGYLLWWKP